MANGNILQSIRSAGAFTSTYSRGESLVRHADVVKWQAYEGNDFADVSGEVRGSRRDPYQVYVSLDLLLGKVVEYYCDCPAHEKYAGMCKHGVALALTYLTSVGLADVRPSVQALSASVNRRNQKTKPAVPPVRTSPEIEKVISNYAAQSVASGVRQDREAQTEQAEADPVDLLCIITPGDTAWRYSWSNDTWALGLKVVRGKVSYVVKSIQDLVQAWHAGALVTYGKRLEFYHRRSAFTDRANQLLDVLSDLVDAQHSLYMAQESRSPYYYGSDSYRISAKTIPISSAQLCDMLELLEGAQVVVEEEVYNQNTGYRKVRETLEVGEGDPDLVVRLAPGEQESFTLDVEPAAASCITDGKRLYVRHSGMLSHCPDEFARALGPFFSEILPLQKPLTIRREDMPSFCAAVLPALRAHAQLEAVEEINDFVPPEPEFTFTVSLQHGYVSCQAEVAYGTQTLSLFEDARDGQPVRDVVREMAAQQLVRTFFPLGYYPVPDYAHPLPASDGSAARRYPWEMYPKDDLHRMTDDPAEPDAPWFYEDDTELYVGLFTEGLRELAELGEVLLSERLRNVTVRSAPNVRVDASVRSGLLDISVTSDDLTGSELAAYLSSYVRKQRFVRLDSGDIVRLDGSVEAVADLADGLGLDAQDLVDGAQGLPTNRTLFVDAMLKRAGGVRFERNSAFRQIVRDFETIADADYTAPEEVRNVLRPYQAEGFKWLCTLGEAGFGGILADDMGLGKTLQLIAYLAYKRERWQESGEEVRNPSLVVCPASLVYNWQAECARFAPQLDVCCVVGNKPARRKVLDAAEDYDLLVTSYDLMRRDVEELCAHRFACVALDEAQYVKNSNTQAAKAARRLDAEVRFALTGTPIENRLLELWSIFDFLMPGVLGTDKSFTQRFADPIGAGEEGASERLQRLVSPFILRRNKRDVLRDLPDKNESVVVATMEGEQAKLYRALETKLALSLAGQKPEEFASSRIKILAELTKLRQVCCDPSLLYENYRSGSAKLETCMELVRQAVGGGHKLLLFSQFTSMLELIEQRLDKERIGWLKLTGATSKEARVRLVEEFQTGSVPVFLISLKAGGTGLNLTAADVVIHYDPWWNLAAQNQATDRTHRIGQKREVSVFKLIAKDTIEEKIVALQEAKRDLAESVLGGEATASTTVSREDILALLGAGEEQ